MADDRTDPRRPGGDIAGPGGPYDVGGVVVDMADAVLLDAVNVALVAGIRSGVLDDEAHVNLLLGGRINKTQERASILFAMPLDGAAGIVAELFALVTRGGLYEEFAELVRVRIAEMP